MRRMKPAAALDEDYQRGGLGQLVSRVLVDNDERCRALLIARLRGRMLEWAGQGPCAGRADPRSIVTRAWEIFWQRLRSESCRVPQDEPEVLHYLKLCVAAAAIEAARATRAGRVASGEVSLLGLRLGEHERAVARLRYGHGLGGAQIRSHRPDLFAEVDAVYRAGHALLVRYRMREPDSECEAHDVSP